MEVGWDVCKPPEVIRRHIKLNNVGGFTPDIGSKIVVISRYFLILRNEVLKGRVRPVGAAPGASAGPSAPAGGSHFKNYILHIKY
jgi:hypothetical protein